jgi:hypothetical protein
VVPPGVTSNVPTHQAFLPTHCGFCTKDMVPAGVNQDKVRGLGPARPELQSATPGEDWPCAPRCRIPKPHPVRTILVTGGPFLSPGPLVSSRGPWFLTPVPQQRVGNPGDGRPMGPTGRKVKRSAPSAWLRASCPSPESPIPVLWEDAEAQHMQPCPSHAGGLQDGPSASLPPSHLWPLPRRSVVTVFKRRRPRSPARPASRGPGEPLLPAVGTGASQSGKGCVCHTTLSSTKGLLAWTGVC